MNILITGSSGFLGRHTANLFSSKGYPIYGVSRSIIPSYTGPQYAVDITDVLALNRIVSEKSIDVIIHLAGKPIVYDCEKNPYDAYRVNGLGTSAVFEAARINKVKKVISVETDKVYGLQEVVPTNEEAVPNPNSPYEFSKYLASKFADFYRSYYGLNIISVRPANLYGPFDFATSRIIPSAFNNLKNGLGIRLYDTAMDNRRDFIYVVDVAKALYTLATEPTEHCIYNISSNTSITVLELANKILSVTGLNIPHNIEQKEKFTEIPYQSIDGSRFTKEFNFTYTSLEEGLLATWNATR